MPIILEMTTLIECPLFKMGCKCFCVRGKVNKFPLMFPRVLLEGANNFGAHVTGIECPDRRFSEPRVNILKEKSVCVCNLLSPL